MDKNRGKVMLIEEAWPERQSLNACADVFYGIFILLFSGIFVEENAETIKHRRKEATVGVVL
jgi:hypothetical protein